MTNLIVRVVESQIFAHSSRLRIANVGSVQKGKEIRAKDERDDHAVRLADQSLLGDGIDLDRTIALRIFAEVRVLDRLTMASLRLDVQLGLLDFRGRHVHGESQRGRIIRLV